MKHTNSPLARVYYPSPHYSERIGPINKITVHHAAAICTAKQLANHFQSKDTRASANYVIGKDGDIICCVGEDCRAWTSGAPGNDNQAVTIEVANSTGAPTWQVSSKAWKSLVALCVDVCRRNGIEQLTYTGGQSGTLTLHCFFQPTECPGPYLKRRMPELAELVNEQLCPSRMMLLEDVPSWGRPTVEWLVERGYLKGNESGLDLSMDMLRTLVVCERMINGGAENES